MTNQSPVKIGLALSGGGLRASFFHIGLLAQMAEQGILKSVAVISTVSGGSIIGALYYLHLKILLESKVDDDIKDKDYIDIIKKIEVEFLKATEKNIRMSVLADFKSNIKMKEPDYSRSDRIAELYNEFLYNKVAKSLGSSIEMRDLKIQPLKGNKNFNPEKHNAKRNAKVPILVVNATTLNAGRNWQFTARTMGEPRARELQGGKVPHIHIDKKLIRLRRAQGDGYQNMAKEQQDFPLGHAVAASSCVPALFAPLAVSHLYYDRDNNEDIVPQLVDGGVFDNQGIESLLKYKCTHFIVSDACGQMGMENQVDTNPLSVLLRVSSVLQDRVRTESLLHLIAEIGEKNIVFIDLRKGLGWKDVSWLDEQGQPAIDDKVTAQSTDEFDVDQRVQEKLSLMRTDLDAFTEVEAYSLMLDAYKMSKADLSQFINAKSQPKEEKWQFTKIAEEMKTPSKKYLEQLKIAESVFGKALMVNGLLWIPFIILVLLGGFLLYSFGNVSLISIVTVLGLWLLTIVAPKFEKILPILKCFRPKVLIAKRFVSAGLLVMGTIFIKLYLSCINPMYVSQGRMDKLK